MRTSRRGMIPRKSHGGRSLSDVISWRAILLLPVFCLQQPSLAHNGQVTLAYPVAGIEIDGDLSDWPASVALLRIIVPGQQEAPGTSPAEFRIGYNSADNSILIAIELFDDGSRGGALRWSFANGNGELTPLSWTDESGLASSRVNRVGASQGTPEVVATIDLSNLGPAAAGQSVAVSQLPTPSASILLSRPRLSAQLAWDVDRDIEVDIAVFARRVATDLAAHGIDVGDSGEGQLRVDLAIDLRSVRVVGGLTFAFVDVSVAVADGQTSLSQIQAPRLKGAGATATEAVRAAFQNSSEYLHEAAAEARRRLLIPPPPHPQGGRLSAESRRLTTRVNRRTTP